MVRIALALPLHLSNLRSWNHLTSTYRSTPEMTLEIILRLDQGEFREPQTKVHWPSTKSCWPLDKICSPFLEARSRLLPRTRL